MTKKTALYPGTFDPVTKGHIDLIERALEIFDRVIVAVAHHSGEKTPLFSIEERVRFLKEVVRPYGKRVTVESFSGLVVEHAKKRGAVAMVRGLRVVSDFEYEFQMALTNRKLAPGIETIFLMPHESYTYLSSRMIKELASLKGDIRSFVPACVLKAVRDRYR